jgi:hypothetical protein
MLFIKIHLLAILSCTCPTIYCFRRVVACIQLQTVRVEAVNEDGTGCSRQFECRESGIAIVLPAHPVCDDKPCAERDDEQREVLVVCVLLETIEHLNNSTGLNAHLGYQQ